MRTRSRFSPNHLPIALAMLALAGCAVAPQAPAPDVAPPVADSELAPDALTDAAPAVGPVVENRGPVLVPPPTPVRPVAVEAAAPPPPPADLIARIRAGFSLPESDDGSVEQELAWYASHPDYIDRVFARGSRYLHHIAEALEARNMPADLALLPIVESAFDPFAYSHGRASGLWQIIPGTGEMLGLKQNWWYDGRRDIVDSTRAALDYLEHLHERFDGDWLLAVAGYNSGEGHVARVIENARREGRSTDFFSIRDDLRSETAAYVPKLLAIRDLVADAETHGIELPVIENAPSFVIVATDGQIDVALAAELGGLSVSALYELNPGINRWATDPDGPHRLLVPADRAEAYDAAFRSLTESERVRWTRHEINRGETLIGIAERYETTPDVLREVNGLAGNLIRAGDHLMIPHASAKPEQYALSVAARTERQQNRERDGNRVDYRVKAGDSLWSIAQRFGVGTQTLAAWNAMAPGDVLSVGRNLVVWSDDPVAASLAALEGPSAVRRVNYVVRSGDSLAAIASRFRVTVSSILDWNGISAERYLQPGQALVLYVDVTEQST